MHLIKSLLILLVFAPHFLSAQQQYFIFQYNDIYGLTDSSGTNLIEGDFESHSDEIRNYALFRSKDDKQILINLKTGKKDIFDEFKGNSIFLENQYFANVEQQGKQFLWSQKTGEKLPLPKVLQGQIYYEVYMINKDFLYGFGYETVFPKTTKKPVAKAKTQSKVPAIKPVEKIEPPKTVRYIYLFKNKRSMPLLHKIEIDDDMRFGGNGPNSFFSFYNFEKKPKTLSNAETAMITVKEHEWNPELMPWHFYYYESFNMVSINVKDKIKLLDSSFNLLKIIPRSTEKSERDVIAEYLESKYPNDNVHLNYADFSPMVGMAGSPRKPFWQVEKKDARFEISYLQEDNYVPYLTLEANEVRITNSNYLFATDNNKNKLMVQLDRKTLQAPIPLKYKQQFKIEKL